MRPVLAMMALLLTAGCAGLSGRAPQATTFGDDVLFLQQHTDVILLTDTENRAAVAVVPQYQGRVMTSTSGGAAGPSYGWINRKRIASRKLLPHMNAYGGEDRFWLGPEGGQYAIFFTPGVPFDYENWQTPAIIDSLPFDVASVSATRALFRKSAFIPNRHGFTFELNIERTVRLLNPLQVESALGLTLPPSVELVAYETENRIINAGEEPWTKASGLLSIWILGMFQPSPGTTVVIPLVAGDESERGPLVNDSYFGKVPADRLRVIDHVAYFRGDGTYRSKIGIPPARARPTIGSYDQDAGVLTLVNYSLPGDTTDYVNSMWEEQQHPYGGDVVNSYNDDGNLGAFYELETSSPARELKPHESLWHLHRTMHLRGNESDLDAIARAALGVSLASIKAAFAPPEPIVEPVVEPVTEALNPSIPPPASEIQTP